MGERFDLADDFTAITIQLASPNDIRSWSYGEIKKPETINYRTYRPERDGLFCERIFGPEKDWECTCGKYRGIKYKDIICDRCGVKITHSKVRRSRMGHINLAAPIVHIWFFKAIPSRLGNLLGIKTTAMQQIVYFQKYVVTYVNPSSELKLELCQLLTEDQYNDLCARYKHGEDFRAGMGAEGIRELLRGLDLDKLSKDLRAELKVCRSKQKREAFTKRLKVAESLLRSNNNSEWMVMDVIPVIPPDLRPLVPLESGNFATSDLNDLYRRVINRNNRLKKLLDLNAPSVIIRNEKRMLQQAVDALFDNGRCRRAVLGSGDRPLKSLTDMIKGKQGRFRENLLGKRVDYSARSVVVIGPDLKLDQCGLPKKIALELYQPFIINKLKERGYADTIKSAKKILERKEEEVWDVLEEVIQNHPVLLNRAPTLHRMGIQAFNPILIEGESIMIHPLICQGFNADFDGDQMAVHLPLSFEARAEAATLMMSTNNIFSPAHGGPIITADLDMVLGCHFLTTFADGAKGEGKAFASKEEVLMALDEGKVHLRARIKLRLGRDITVLGPEGPETSEKGVYETSPGRVIFNDILPEGTAYYNKPMNKPALNEVISDCYRVLGRMETVGLLDRLKYLGFHYATVSGLSFAASDLKIPASKQKVIRRAEKEVDRIQRDYQKGLITDGERYNQVIDTWTKAREEVWRSLMEELRNDERKDEPNYVNPIFMMVGSGARGSVQQIGQLAGMRGLMAKPSGKVIETPIKANFREGLRGLEYFSSTHGARKGLADTALKTANSGYLTRKLVEVAQDVVITEQDCGTQNGLSKGVIYRGDQVEVTLAEAITGRVARDNIVSFLTDEIIVRENEIITKEKARKIEDLNYEKVRVRSPLTCEADYGICAGCYGADLSTERQVEEGTAVGIIAAQSVGEPGTQLTMRTFHIGGIGVTRIERSEIRNLSAGTVKFRNLNVVTNNKGERVVLDRNGELLILDLKGRDIERYTVPPGAVVFCEEGTDVPVRKLLVKWDRFMTPILTEVAGLVSFLDVIEDVTMRKEIDPGTGFERMVIVEHKGDYHPQVELKDDSDATLALYPIPERAHLEVNEGDRVTPGQLLARTPREISGSQDITGGLPRVTELFEARKPKDSAIMSEVDGVVELGERKRGKRTIIVKPDAQDMKPIEHLVPAGKHLVVRSGDRVRAGDKLVDGPLVPGDILRISGPEKVQEYLLQEVQGVYRSQGVKIDDKHIEALIRQMLRQVKIDDPGDTDFLASDVVSKAKFKRKNEEIKKGGKPATASPELLGIAKASLQSDSFISAASFQETTKVLTAAAIEGRRDILRGLKENVIIGHMIPAGTGFHALREGELQKVERIEEPPEPAQLEASGE